jgi:predicted O-linked N-acetylglucosamine transferase (SPINDLY family)
VWSGERYDHGKIRIGYVSGEFRYQATSILIAELFERHDKDRFALYAFDNGWDDRSSLRARINRACDEVIDISGLDDAAAATAIRQREIDILVDLNGYFGSDRTGVFARKPAPVQVNYLGFPGTMGADYMDYIIADAVVIPPEQRTFYTEKVVYLPDAYQANDTKRRFAERVPAREEFGLPEQAFVFCCFNNTYKITPDMFDIWMRLLGRVEGSVLWLLQHNELTPRNLRREAEQRGIAPERLVFAKGIPLEEHLARHRLADLFLDTLPYNAHTTGNDALWAGLPLVTCQGATFPGRVASSLLRAAGLPELIAGSLAEYEELALKLAQDRALLASLKAKLARNRETCALFNSERFARHIEAAYTTMWERSRRGDAPESFAIEPI